MSYPRVGARHGEEVAIEIEIAANAHDPAPHAEIRAEEETATPNAGKKENNKTITKIRN